MIKDTKIPIILFNGANNWTACRSYKEYLSGYKLFGDSIIDFKYLLIDINRYSDEELLKMSNLIGSVFLIDKKQDFDKLLENLGKLINVFKELSPKEFELFKNWFRNIIIRGIEPEDYKKVDRIIRDSKEGESMVYNLEITLKEEKEKNRREGKIEGKIEGILLLLQDLSEVPQELENIIRLQKNHEIISKWLRLAAKVNSIEEFMSKM